MSPTFRPPTSFQLYAVFSPRSGDTCTLTKIALESNLHAGMTKALGKSEKGEKHFPDGLMRVEFNHILTIQAQGGCFDVVKTAPLRLHPVTTLSQEPDR